MYYVFLDNLQTKAILASIISIFLSQARYGSDNNFQKAKKLQYIKGKEN